MKGSGARAIPLSLPRAPACLDSETVRARQPAGRCLQRLDAPLPYCLDECTQRCGSGRRQPAETSEPAALGAKYLLNAHSDLLVREKLFPIELIQPFLYLLPKPCVVVDVPFDELLDVLSGFLAVLRRNPENLGFQLWI